MRPAVVTVIAGQSMGTGFIVRPEGVVVTAWHVVAGQTTATVRLPGGRECKVAGLLAYRPDRDYAVLKLADAMVASRLPTVVLGDSSRANSGEAVFTVGSPLGREQRLTEGVILSRRHGREIADEIVLDAGVRPGNSGGPLADARGEIIGIVTGAVSGTENLGFATAIGELRIPPLNAPLVTLAEASRGFPGSAEGLFIRGQGLMKIAESHGAPVGAAALRSKEEIGLLEAALKQFEAAANRRKTLLSAWINAGICHSELDRHKEALRCFEAVLALCPNDLVGRLCRANELSHLGRLDESQRITREITAGIPTFAAAHLLLGRLLSDSGKRVEGLAEMEVAERLQPGNPLIIFYLGRANLTAGRLDSAIEALARVAVQRPGYAEAHALLGNAYGRAGQHVRAVAAYRSALALHPDLPEAHLGLAIEYLALGDGVRARLESRRVRQLDSKLARKLPAELN